MKKVVIFHLIVSILFAIEIKIVPDKQISVSTQEINTVVQNFLKNHLRISKKDAIKFIKNNRKLSNLFLKEYKIPKDLYISLRLQVEEKLANLYVKNKQKNIKISNEVIESYYKTHKKDFIQDEKISFIAYQFKNFNDALTFYQSKKLKNPSLEGIKVELFKSQIDPIIAPLFSNVKKGEMTPPTFYRGSYVVFKITDIQPSRVLSLKESKEKIKKILLQKIFLRTKKELLKNK